MYILLNLSLSTFVLRTSSARAGSLSSFTFPSVFVSMSVTNSVMGMYSSFSVLFKSISLTKRDIISMCMFPRVKDSFQEITIALWLALWRMIVSVLLQGLSMNPNIHCNNTASFKDSLSTNWSFSQDDFATIYLFLEHLMMKAPTIVNNIHLFIICH